MDYENIAVSMAKLLEYQAKHSLALKTAASPRAFGDALERIVAELLPSVLGDRLYERLPGITRRSLADFAFTGATGEKQFVDVKTQRLDAEFSLPNLISIERLAKLYQDDSCTFSLFIVSYFGQGCSLRMGDVHFCPIEHLSWNCLAIGSLGCGQLQLKPDRLQIDRSQSRPVWMTELCSRACAFYQREEIKLNARRNRFELLEQKWAMKKGRSPHSTLTLQLKLLT